MALETVVTSLAPSGILTVTLNRPKRKNAVNTQMYLDLVAVFDSASEDDLVSALILTGAGGGGARGGCLAHLRLTIAVTESFTSGADVSASDDPGPEDLMTAPVGLFMQAMIKFPKLIVAAVNGPAVGIGVTLLPHCDVVFASTTATFWTPFARIAVVPEFCSSVLFPAVMGISRANEMLLLGKQFNAQEAHASGLVSALYPPADLMANVVKAVEGALVYPLAAKSLGVFKKLVRSDKYVAEMLDVCRQELLVLRERINNGDTVTAVLALLESRAKSKL